MTQDKIIYRAENGSFKEAFKTTWFSGQDRNLQDIIKLYPNSDNFWEVYNSRKEILQKQGFTFSGPAFNNVLNDKQKDTVIETHEKKIYELQEEIQALKAINSNDIIETLQKQIQKLQSDIDVLTSENKTLQNLIPQETQNETEAGKNSKKNQNNK